MKLCAMFPAALATALCASAAHAKDCEIRPSNLDAFGKYHLGPLRALPKDVRVIPKCAVSRKYHYFDCEFVDAQGTDYLAVDHEIAKLERGPEKSTVLPPSYPLKFGMSFGEVRRILSVTDPKIEFSAGSSPGKSYSIDTEECLKSSRGITYYFSAQFDGAGRLNKLTAAFEVAED